MLKSQLVSICIFPGVNNLYMHTLDIHSARRNLFHPASLFEVQSISASLFAFADRSYPLILVQLISMYLRGTGSFPAAWLVVSVGIRKAQDVGAHRKKVYRGHPTVDEELWKRAFWHLVVFDRVGGSTLGRGCGVVEEEYV